MKYQLIIEAETLIGLIQNIRKELKVMTEQEENANRMDEIMKTKINCEVRKRKEWTQFDIDFLVEHYKSKRIEWIAKALLRPRLSVHQKLNQLYKKGLPKKNNTTKNL